MSEKDERRGPGEEYHGCHPQLGPDGKPARAKFCGLGELFGGPRVMASEGEPEARRDAGDPADDPNRDAAGEGGRPAGGEAGGGT